MSPSCDRIGHGQSDRLSMTLVSFKIHHALTETYRSLITFGIGERRLRWHFVRPKLCQIRFRHHGHPHCPIQILLLHMARHRHPRPRHTNRCRARLPHSPLRIDWPFSNQKRFPKSLCRSCPYETENNDSHFHYRILICMPWQRRQMRHERSD